MVDRVGMRKLEEKAEMDKGEGEEEEGESKKKEGEDKEIISVDKAGVGEALDPWNREESEVADGRCRRN